MRSKHVFKIGTRFGKVNVYKAFKNNSIVFIGGYEEKYWANCMRDIHEDDIVLVSNGYTIVAVAEVRTPAADIHCFNLIDDSFLKDLDDDGITILGCKVDFYPLDEQDCFTYEHQGRVCKVQKKKS